MPGLFSYHHGNAVCEAVEVPAVVLQGEGVVTETRGKQKGSFTTCNMHVQNMHVHVINMHVHVINMHVHVINMHVHVTNMHAADVHVHACTYRTL